MGRLTDLVAQEPPPDRELPAPDLPKGWEPGVRWSNDLDAGTIVTDATTTQPDAAIWRELIADWGLDPDALEVVDGSIELIGWDAPIKGTDQRQRLKRYKARLRRKTNAADTVDMAILTKAALRTPTATPRRRRSP